MKNKHTPGPWNAVEYAGVFILQAENFYSIEDDLLDKEKCAKAQANAKLAECAPELLEALQTIRPLVGGLLTYARNHNLDLAQGDMVAMAINLIDAALAKAQPTSILLAPPADGAVVVEGKTV